MSKYKTLAKKDFGNLRPIESIKRKSGYNWKCLCLLCNNECIFPANEIVQYRKSCGCNKFKDPIGQKINHLTILKRIKSEKNKDQYECLCDCGNIKKINVHHVINKRGTKSCGCLSKLKPGHAALNKILDSYKRSAKNKKINYSLSYKEFQNLLQNNCFYCGAKPSNCQKTKNGNYIYNGIDRKDNNIGYIVDNCVSCCIICNKAKRDMSFQDFIDWIISLYNHNADFLYPPRDTNI